MNEAGEIAGVKRVSEEENPHIQREDVGKRKRPKERTGVVMGEIRGGAEAKEEWNKEQK